ncbi:MAG TPA: caspase family protein [Thermoanaerobaculia bacterium]|nr:caspase family protein [Thermoanaerobaculia bacterium]
MALILDDPNRTVGAAHALVIGVGGYRHMPGGADPKDPVLQQVGLLPQLTSPPRSAVGFARFLLETKDDWHRPLGSIDLLVSPAPEDPDPFDGLTADPATIGSIRTAYAGWRARCDRSEDNQAIFYFCGHGVAKREQYLMAEDFGGDAFNPWLGAFAFDSTRLAFHACAAKTQCFFIDACRNVTTPMLLNEPTAIPLEVLNFSEGECDHNLTMRGTAHNERALGPKKKVSYFTQALIRALRGAAATQGDGGWVVETGQVSAHITTILRMVKESEGFTQRASSEVTGGVPLLRVSNPKVELVLSCDPSDADGIAELECTSPTRPFAESRHGAPWKLAVEPGFYIAKARFPNHEFRDVTEEIIAVPPAKKPVLRCQP